jgi:signal transduction histidine kinase
MTRTRLLAALIAMLVSFAGHAAARPDPVVLGAQDDVIGLAPALELLEDVTGKLDIDTVAASTGFRPSTGQPPNFGYKPSVAWMRFRLARAPGAPADWMLAIGFPTIDHVTLYERTAAGGWRQREGGDSVAARGTDETYRRPVFPIALPEGTAAEFYVRVESVSAKLLTADLFAPAALERQSMIELVVHSVYFGALVAIALFVAGAGLLLRDRVYGCYVLWILATLWTNSELLGYPRLLVWGVAPQLTNISTLAASSAAVSTGVVFVTVFLDLARVAPWVDRICRIYATLPALSLILFFLVDGRLGYRCHSVIALFAPIILVLAVVPRIAAGQREARMLFLAWMITMLGVALFQLRNLEIVPITPITSYLHHLGTAIGMVAFAAAIAERFRRISDRVDTELRRREMRLEAQIDQRVQAIARANRDLGRAAEQHAQAKSRLEAANEAKNAFLARVGRELRAPLDQIAAFAALVRRQKLGPVCSPRYIEFAGYIDESGQHLRDIVDDMLGAVSSAPDGVELAPSYVDPRRLAEASLMFVRGAAKAKDIALEVSISDPPPVIIADFRAAKQMLINLAANAIKFTPRGGRVTLRMEPDRAGGAAIAIEDTGIGMTEAELERALEPFGQVDPAASAGGQGTGLGLPLVRSLIEMHGGRLEAHSLRGAGTSMRLVFPPLRAVA